MRGLVSATGEYTTLPATWGPATISAPLSLVGNEDSAMLRASSGHRALHLH
jgi:hypothetical protein